MDEIPPESSLKSSCPASLSPTTHYEVGFQSTVSVIAQQQLNDSRKALLTSATLPATHDFRKRANAADGTLLPTQPDGTPRKAYEHDKIPKPRARKDKEAATYFLGRHLLVNMWNGKWTRDSDWEAWDKSKSKMEKQFTNYRLVEHPPPLKEWQVRKSRRRERKRKREKDSLEAESPSKKHRCEAEDTKKPSEESTHFPTPEDVLAATPLEGIRMELLLAKFWYPKWWDTERWCDMLHKIGTVNKYTKMFVPGKRGIAQFSKEIYGGRREEEDIPIHPALLQFSSGNACVRTRGYGCSEGKMG